MSIVRIGLSESKQFAEGYAAIFGGKKGAASKDKPAAKAAGKKVSAKKATAKKSTRKKTAKKK